MKTKNRKFGKLRKTLNSSFGEGDVSFDSHLNLDLVSLERPFGCHSN